MRDSQYNILVLCTGNSARSILAEALLNELGTGRVKAHSAGSHPKGEPHPLALAALVANGHRTDGLRSKSWEEFARSGAPKMDLVLTVCSNAVGEVCPIWPGHPATAHWDIADPAAESGRAAARQAAFARTYDELRSRVVQLLMLPLEALPPAELARRVSDIKTGMA